MKNARKKMLSLLLAVLLLASFCPVSAFADEGGEQAEEAQTEGTPAASPCCRPCRTA